MLNVLLNGNWNGAGLTASRIFSSASRSNAPAVPVLKRIDVTPRAHDFSTQELNGPRLLIVLVGSSCVHQSVVAGTEVSEWAGSAPVSC